MTRRTGALLALLLAGACAAPAPALVDFSDRARDYRDKDYSTVYGRWTRHEWARHEVDAALEVWATFKSWDYREAYVERYAAIYSLPESEERVLREAQREAFQGAYEFHLTAQSTNYKWNDLEKKDSAWRVSLLDALGQELTPESIRVIKLPDAYEREFFPSKTPFTKTYAVRFTLPTAETQPPSDFKGPKTGSIKLRIASPVGRIELVWQSS